MHAGSAHESRARGGRMLDNRYDALLDDARRPSAPAQCRLDWAIGSGIRDRGCGE